MPDQNNAPSQKLESLNAKSHELRSALEEALDLPPSAEERIEAFEKKLDYEMELFLAEDRLSHSSVERIEIARGYRELRESCIHFVNTKMKNGPGEARKGERVAELKQSILENDVERERICSQLEDAGIEAERPGDLDPGVFLEALDESSSPNVEKFVKLRERRHKIMIALKNLGLELFACRGTITELTQNLEGSTANGNETSKLRRQLDEWISKQAGLQTVYEEQSRRGEAVRALAQASEHFLEQRNIKIPPENTGMFPVATGLR